MNPTDYFQGWNIHRFTHHGRDHFAASRHGVGLNTNSLEGLKLLIQTKNLEILKQRHAT
jgi:hypothetical protein